MCMDALADYMDALADCIDVLASCMEDYRVAEARFFADAVLLLLMVPVWVVPGGL